MDHWQSSSCGNEDLTGKLWGMVATGAGPCTTASRAGEPGSSSPDKGFGLFQLIFPAQGLSTALLQHVHQGFAVLPSSLTAFSLPDVSPILVSRPSPLKGEPESPCLCQGTQEQGPKSVGES